MVDECLVEVLADAAIVYAVTSFLENLKFFANPLVRETVLFHFLFESSLKIVPAFADQVETRHEFHSIGLEDGVLKSDRLASSYGVNSLFHQAFVISNLSIGETNSDGVGGLRGFVRLSALRGTSQTLLDGDVHKGWTCLFSLWR